MLGDFINFTKGFAFKSSSFVSSGIKIVKVGNLNSNMSESSEWYYIDESEFETYKKYQIKDDDVIVSTVGSWENNPNSKVGKACIFFDVKERLLLNQNAVIIRTNNNEILRQKYLKYLVYNKAFGDYIIGCAQGSANQASITLNDIRNFRVEIPDIKIQDKIISILDSIILKINLNNEINNNLRELCKTNYLRIIENDRIEISLSELMDYQGGSQPPASEFQKEKNDNNIRFVQIRDFETDSYICYIPNSNKNKLCNKDDILIARYGASLGRICYGLSGAYNVALAKVISKKEEYKELLRVILEADDFYNYINQVGQRSAQAGFNAGDIAGYNVIIPDENGLKEFNSISKNVIDKRLLIMEENRKLSELRDTLLPKLMNGEIDLENIEI